MSGHQSTAAAMHVITLSREYGSGGGEIAARLARRLAWRLIDHELVVRVARQLGVPAAAARAYDEQADVGLLARFLRTLSPLEAGGLLDAGAPEGAVAEEAVDPRAYHATLRRVVEATAGAGQVVIVGRGAQVLLAARRDALHVRWWRRWSSASPMLPSAKGWTPPPPSGASRPRSVPASATCRRTTAGGRTTPTCTT